jgi:SnoaL-like domain
MELDPIERLLAERACERLIVEYSHRLDLGQASRVVELFTDDAVWETTGRIRAVGREEIAAGLSGGRIVPSGRTGHHICTNIAIDVHSADEATGLCYLINYRHDSPNGIPARPVAMVEPRYIGEYHDRFLRTPNGWRFAHRRSELAFAHDGGEASGR